MDELEYEQTVAAERQSCFVYQLIADVIELLSKERS